MFSVQLMRLSVSRISALISLKLGIMIEPVIYTSLFIIT